MRSELNYLEKNKNLWNQKTGFHIKSDFYNIENFLNGESSLNKIELDLLGDISGKKILHLQCHFGQDSISLARLGAKVTGVDFSDKAIDQANILSKKAQIPVDFICCDIYELPNHLEETYDLVFASYGTIGWLPDLNKWAGIISKYLKPGGEFVFAEFHPVVWMFDDNFKKIQYNYLKSEPIVETEVGTYADKKAEIEQESVTWNHGISEVVNSLIQNQLEINRLNEYDYSPYNCFNGMCENKAKKFRIEHLDNKIPMVYAIVATKKE